MSTQDLWDPLYSLIAIFKETRRNPEAPHSHTPFFLGRYIFWTPSKLAKIKQLKASVTSVESAWKESIPQNQSIWQTSYVLEKSTLTTTNTFTWKTLEEKALQEMEMFFNMIGMIYSKTLESIFGWNSATIEISCSWLQHNLSYGIQGWWIFKEMTRCAEWKRLQNWATRWNWKSKQKESKFYVWLYVILVHFSSSFNITW